MRATGFRDIDQIIRVIDFHGTRRRIRITCRAQGALLQKQVSARDKQVSARNKPVSSRDPPVSARDRDDVISGRA